jgi:AcrR family transcriptional regulator
LVESPSGRGRTPRKRVMGQPIRGFKSHLHRHPEGPPSDAGRRPFSHDRPSVPTSMYHHFTGKPDLALEAVRRSAEQVRAKAEAELSGPAAAYERISAYLLRERGVLRGCPVGRLTQDPEIMASPSLREPLEETFGRLRQRLADVLAEGRARGEFDAALDPPDTAATIMAVLQGGYVRARVEGVSRAGAWGRRLARQPVRPVLPVGHRQRDEPFPVGRGRIPGHRRRLRPAGGAALDRRRLRARAGPCDDSAPGRGRPGRGRGSWCTSRSGRPPRRACTDSATRCCTCPRRAWSPSTRAGNGDPPEKDRRCNAEA